MREAGRIKMGFYPAPRQALQQIIKRISQVDDQAVIVDPCAGEGQAVQYLASKLGIDESRLVASELDAVRSQALAKRLPDSRVTQVADFQAAYFPRGQASLLYLNPPFDDELGSKGRGEKSFLVRATTMLRKFGLLVFIMPRQVLRSSSDIRLFLENHYLDCETFDFPTSVRKYDECVVMAYKRDRPRVLSHPTWGFLNEPMPAKVRYQVRAGEVFELQKREYTDQELGELMDYDSVLKNNTLLSRHGAGVARPPLQLKDGHKALLLAAGHLNGRVEKPGEPPHVVRGTSRKQVVEKSKSSVSNGKFDVTTEERIELVIRTVDSSGEFCEISDSHDDAH